MLVKTGESLLARQKTLMPVKRGMILGRQMDHKGKQRRLTTEGTAPK